MNFRIARLMTLVVCLLSTGAMAAGGEVSEAVKERLRAALEKPGTGVAVESIEASEMDGFYRVQVTNGPVLYVAGSGDYFIAGDLFRVENDGFVNLAELRRNKERLALLDDVKRSDMIIFSPEGEARAGITVFTDTTCFYCQKLHREVGDLNAHGIEVRYLAYPRGGIGSEGYNQLVTAWCAKDQQKTLTRLKNRENVEPNQCDDNPVADEFALGQKVGVRGTPAIVTDSGMMIPGYKSADELARILGVN